MNAGLMRRCRAPLAWLLAALQAELEQAYARWNELE